MKQERTEQLYQAVTDMDEQFVQEAEICRRKGRKGRRWRQLTAVAAVLTTGVLLWRFGVPFGGNAGGGGHAEESVFQAYAGPVFPLSLAQWDPDILAARELTFDFAPYLGKQEPYENAKGEQRSHETYETKALITDRYRLTNVSGEDKTVTLLYPYVGELFAAEPVLTLDGEAAETKRLSGGLFGWADGGITSIEGIRAYEEYEALLADGGYLQQARSPAQSLDLPVTVYEISQAKAEQDCGETPHLAMEFTLDDTKTTVFSYGFEGGRYDPEAGFQRRSFTVGREGDYGYGQSHYLIVAGEDIADYSLQGYTDGGCETQTEGITARVERYESTLGEMLQRLLERYLGEYSGSEPFWLEPGNQNRCLDAAAGYLFSQGLYSQRLYGDNSDLELIFNKSIYGKRIHYLVAEATIQAGQTVEVAAAFPKEGSYDHTCSQSKNRGVAGYDMATRLGAKLNFTGQTAVIEDRGAVEIVRQNFGFDLEKDVKTVTLNLEEEHYYLEVRRKD